MTAASSSAPSRSSGPTRRCSSRSRPRPTQQIKTTFATYADLKAQRASYDAAMFDYSADEPADVVPWPPSDV